MQIAVFIEQPSLGIMNCGPNAAVNNNNGEVNDVWFL
jgi:hypothetical protein